MVRPAVELVYPRLRFDLDRDGFVVWLRWVSLEQPPSPEEPPAQGIRVELQLNRNTVLGPTVAFRRDLEQAPLFLRAPRTRCAEVLRVASRRYKYRLHLIIHVSIAHATDCALYHRPDAAPVPITAPAGLPLLRIQPSPPCDR